MKQYYWLIGFILLTLVGDRIGGGLLHQVIDRSQFRYSRLYTDRAAAEILFLGNSRGLPFYQPWVEEQLDVSTFNMSYNGLPVDLAKVLVSDYLDRYPAPRLAVIDITLADRFDERLIINFSPYTAMSERIDSLIRQTDRTAHAGIHLSHLYRYNSELFQRALYYMKNDDRFWQLDRRLSEEVAGSLPEDYEFIIRYPEAAPRLLGDIVQLLKQQGTEVKLVIGPYYPGFAKYITNLRDLKADVERTTGMQVHDFSLAVNERELFADFQHLNREGSQLYMDMLISEGILR